jgi:hypothetical protein
MKFYLGVTDTNWYKFLASQNREDVNFWQPGGNTNFKLLPSGATFLFKLKFPTNAIGGIGFFQVILSCLFLLPGMFLIKAMDVTLYKSYKK